MLVPLKIGGSYTLPLAFCPHYWWPRLVDMTASGEISKGGLSHREIYAARWQGS